MADERAYNVDTDRLRKRILQAISGPAKFVFRTIADGWEEPGPQWQSRAVMSVVEPALRQAYLDGHDAGFAAANVDDPWAGHPNPAAPLDHELRVQVRRAIAKSYGYESWAAVTAVEDGESEGITGAADAAISVFAPVLAERDLLRWLHAEAMWHLGQAGEVLKAVREERDAAAERDARTIDVLRNERVALWNERDEAARALASIKNRDHWEKPPTLADRVELVASELDIARDQIENLRASYEQKVQDFSRETLRLSAVLARCEKNAVPIHVVGEAGLGWEDAQEHIKGGVAQADTLWAAQQEGAGGSGVGLQSEPDHSCDHEIATACSRCYPGEQPDNEDIELSESLKKHAAVSPATPAEPRVWRIGDPEPRCYYLDPGACYLVHDKAGRLWVRREQREGGMWDRKSTRFGSVEVADWTYLTKAHGPVVEVVEDQPGGGQ